MARANIAVFEDTRSMYTSDTELHGATENSAANQKIILEEDTVENALCRFAEKAKVIVSQKRSFEAAQAYAAEKKVCVLNFASSVNPGGGVLFGASAQEECLCRCSTLYPCLDRPETWNSFYNPHRTKNNPLHDDDCIYTPDVVVFKSDTRRPELMNREQWYKVNVITCAAPDLRWLSDEKLPTVKGLFDIHFKRLRRILDIAAMQGNEVVILGAFGCGAFENNPSIVAAAMNEAVKEYLHKFETIEFAVYCPPYDDENYREFRQNISQN